MYFQKSFSNATRTEQVIRADCRQLASHQRCVVFSAASLAGGQPLNSSVRLLGEA